VKNKLLAYNCRNKKINEDTREKLQIFNLNNEMVPFELQEGVT
jgi:hypothetical protein